MLSLYNQPFGGSVVVNSLLIPLVLCFFSVYGPFYNAILSVLSSLTLINLSQCMRFYATSEASDQPAHTRSLIRAFASRFSIL